MKKVFIITVLLLLIVTSFVACKETENVVDDANSKLSEVGSDVVSDTSKVESGLESHMSDMKSDLESNASEVESKIKGIFDGSKN